MQKVTQRADSSSGQNISGAVYLHYTQAELDRAYTQSEWAPNSREVLARQSARSAQVRAEFKYATYQYGPGADETLDAFSPVGSGRPIHVHVHGGGWRSLSKDDVSFPAPMFTRAGAVYIALNFSTIPRVRLPEMVAQTQRAIAWIHTHADVLGGSPDRIHLSGHSSGGHLAALLMTTDWQALFGLPSDVLKSGLLMSGSYDMGPVMLSVRRTYVSISKDEQDILSPIRHIEQLRSPIVVAIGDRESPEFKRQAECFVDRAMQAARRAQLLRVDDANHFEVMDVFADPKSGLAQTALRAMNLVSDR